MKSIAINQAWNGAEKCQQCRIRELVLFADLQRDDFDLLHKPIIDYIVQTGETLYQEKQAPILHAVTDSEKIGIIYRFERVSYT